MDWGPWRQRVRHLYTQYCYRDELPWKLEKLLATHTTAFDDSWTYWLAKSRGRPVALRRPLWLTKPESSRYAEKGDDKRRRKGQTLLKEV